MWLSRNSVVSADGGNEAVCFVHLLDNRWKNIRFRPGAGRPCDQQPVVGSEANISQPLTCRVPERVPVAVCQLDSAIRRWISASSSSMRLSMKSRSIAVKGVRNSDR
jgi:hypothetical protein